MSDEENSVELDEEEKVEIPEMHDLFSDWLRPTDLGINRETLNLRWASIAQLRDESLEDENLEELVRVALGGPLLNDGPSHWFRQILKSHDDFFPMQADEHKAEIENLSSACLAACLDDANNLDRSRSLATILLAASFSDSRKFSSGGDLVSAAKKLALSYGIKNRNRVSPPLPTLHCKVNTKTQEVIDAVVNNQPTTYIAALNGVLEELSRQLRTAQSSLRTYSTKTANQTIIRDEELEILWWLFGDKSHLLNTAMSDIDPSALPLVLGVELAQRTNLDAELPSLSGLLSKAGLATEKEISFKSLINSGKDLSSALLKEVEYSPYITPTLHALSITRDNSSWQKSWESETGLNTKTIKTGLEWATQIYRETLYTRHWR